MAVHHYHHVTCPNPSTAPSLTWYDQRHDDARREAAWRKRKEDEAARARSDKIADRKAARDAAAAARHGSPRAARPHDSGAGTPRAAPRSPRSSSGYGQSSGYGSPRASSRKAADDDALGKLGQDLLTAHMSPTTTKKKKIVVRSVHTDADHARTQYAPTPVGFKGAWVHAHSMCDATRCAPPRPPSPHVFRAPSPISGRRRRRCCETRSCKLRSPRARPLQQKTKLSLRGTDRVGANPSPRCAYVSPTSPRRTD